MKLYLDNFCSLLLKCITTVYSIVSMGSIITHVIVSMCKDTDINSYAHRYNTCTHACIQTYAYTEDTDQEFFQKTYSVGQSSL